jgi:hypothetical protein
MQKNAGQAKEEETTSEKIHKKQVVTQRTRMEAGTDDTGTVISSLFPSDLGESNKPDKTLMLIMSAQAFLLGTFI